MKASELPPGRFRDAAEAAKGRQSERAPIRAKRAMRSKWEEHFADQVLAVRLKAGEIADWRYESLKIKVGISAWYKVDSIVEELDGSYTAYEVKGFKREASIVRLKTAAMLWPKWRFVFVTRGRGAGWSYTSVG